MPNALTLECMSPELVKVAEQPRVVSTEEPDGGNLQVRIWGGPRLGNWPGLLDWMSNPCSRQRPTHFSA